MSGLLGPYLGDQETIDVKLTTERLYYGLVLRVVKMTFGGMTVVFYL